MANINNNPEKNDKQDTEFASNQELKSKVYDAIEEQLKESSDKAFKSEGIKTREIKDQKGEQGWNRGEYGDGSKYGTGVAKGQSTVTVNRVKGSKATNGFFEKNLSFGGKKMVIEIHVDIDAESKTLDMTYKTTEDSFFRGHQDKKGPFMINDKLFFDIDNLSEFKKELKDKFDGYAVREANYFIKTKLGIEDRTEKSINSMVENNMKKLSLKDIIKGDFDETIEKIMESSKKKDKEQNHPEVKDANSPDDLLFDEKKEDGLDEITTAGAGAAGSVGQIKYDAPLSGINKRDFNDTAYSKKEKKRSLKRENNGGWTTVELDSNGYAPKGMDKTHTMGFAGVEINSAEEERRNKGIPKGKLATTGKLHEGLDQNKRKFITESENNDKGVNKRYIITHKKSAEEESNRWKNLSNFEKNSTIKIAESCGCPVDNGTSEKMVTREQGEKEIANEFMKRNTNLNHGDEINGKKVIVVSKPGSLSGAEFKVFEEDFMNENKSFILDFNSGNLVNNPNYKAPVVIKEAEIIVPKEKKIEPINESSAYILNTDTGQLIRNKNFKAKK